jgi:ParB family chromosome partitioning protein
MARNIKYRPVSKALEAMVKPGNNSNIRPSLGLDGTVGEFFYISVDDLIPFHNQARISFDEEEILSLAESVKLHGIRQPLTVFLSNNKYEVVSGERRLKAARLIGLKKVPCIIIKDSTQADAIALIENIHRKDLHPIELGVTYKNLLEKNIFNTQLELAEKISVTKSQISEYLKYAELDNEIKNYIIDNKIYARDKLRSVVKACSSGNLEKAKKILGITSVNKVNFSILRITSSDGSMTFQEKGIQKLSPQEKTVLKNYLTKIINDIHT